MRYVLLLGLFLLVGCGPPAPPPTPEQVEAELQEYGKSELPNEAKKVMDLGNGWRTFELETDGVNRKFLFHRAGDYSGDGQWSQESITEMSPASLP